MRKLTCLLLLALCLPVAADTAADLRALMKERSKLQSADNLATIEKLLEAQPALATTPIQRLNGPGTSLPLNEALFAGDVELAGVLLAKGADPNAPTGTKDMRPLAWAMNDYLDPKKILACVELLVESGADPNLGNEVGVNALHRWAARRSLRESDVYPKLLDALVRGKADLAATTEAGFTALMISVTNNNAPAVKLLLAKGADPKQKTRFGNALELAQEEAGKAPSNQEAQSVLQLLQP